MIQKLFSEKKTKRKLLIFGLIFVAIVGCVYSWVYKFDSTSNIRKTIINVYTTDSFDNWRWNDSKDDLEIAKQDVFVYPFQLGWNKDNKDREAIQLNIKKKVNDFLIKHYRDHTPGENISFNMIDLERIIMKEIDEYFKPSWNSFLRGKVYSSDGVYDYSTWKAYRFREDRVSNYIFNFKLSKDAGKLEELSNYRRNGDKFTQNWLIRLCNFDNEHRIPICHETENIYTRDFNKCTFVSEELFFPCIKKISNTIESVQEGANRSNLKNQYYASIFTNFNLIDLYKIEFAIKDITFPSFQEFIDTNNLKSVFETFVTSDYFLQWNAFDFRSCLNKNRNGDLKECDVIVRKMDKEIDKLFHLYLSSCTSCDERLHELKFLYDLIEIDQLRHINFRTLINANLSFEKFKKLRLQEYEQEYNKVKKYFDLLNDFIKETHWITAATISSKSYYKGNLNIFEELKSFGLDQINLRNIEALNDADKISLVNRILLKNVNKECNTFSYSNVDSICQYYRNYILAKEPELTKEYFYKLGLASRFIELYELILFYPPSFEVDDEFKVRLKFLQRIKTTLTLNKNNDYNHYSNLLEDVDFGVVNNINFVEVATLEDRILTKKLNIPLFDGHYYCETCFYGLHDRSKEFIDDVLSQKKKLESDPMLKSIYDYENKLKLKFLLDFYLGIVVLPFLVNE